MTVASWAGMRGVVTLVAALALPIGPPAFPERDRLIFIAFVVIVGTLLVQGLTLPLLVRVLGVRAADDDRDELEQQLLRRARDAGFRRLDEIGTRADADVEVIEQARDNADRMWHSLGFRDATAERNADHATHVGTINAIKDELLAAARDEVVEARSESGTDPAIVDQVLRRLDTRGSQPE